MSETSQRIQPAPVRRSVTVKAPPARAFEVFTTGIGRWWPKSHHISATDLQTVIIEPRLGGRWYELAVDGAECEVGKVLVWDPPARVVLAWQVSADWKYDPDLITELEIRFTAEGDGSTRVELEHRNLERFGDRAEATRAQIDGPMGWGGLLQLFADVAAQ